jgi:protein-disulfide isomerase-like protein with CxxC motif
MTNDDLQDAARFLMDLHFIQANAIVAAQLQDNKKAIEYMQRIAQVREAIKSQLKEKSA